MVRILLVVACISGMAGLSLGDDRKELSDEEITKLMVGKWEHTSRFNTTTIRTVEEFNKDGTLVRMDTINDSQNIYTKATWAIKDGVVTTVIVEGGLGKGVTVKGTVMSIDDKSQFVKMEAGAEVTKTRVKQ